MCVCAKGDLWLELALKAMGAPKSHNLLPASWRTRKKPLIKFHPKTEGWRAQAASGLSLSRGQSPENQAAAAVRVLSHEIQGL